MQLPVDEQGGEQGQHHKEHGPDDLRSIFQRQTGTHIASRDAADGSGEIGVEAVSAA